MPPDRNPAPQIVALDGLRGVALLAVLTYHFVGQGPGAVAWPGWLRTAALAGWAGVDLFFVLSGFLITRILLASRGRPGALRVFYMRRAVRIFPPYYAILIVLTAALIATGFRDDEAWHLSALWLYLVNFDVARHGWGVAVFRSVQFTHLWTLAIEEQFYLAWPWLVLFGPRRLLPVCGVLIVGTAVTRGVMLLGGTHGIAVYASTYCRADALAWGAFVAVCAVTWPAERVRRAGIVLAVIGALATAGVFVAERSVSEYGPLMQSAGYSAIAAAFAGVIAILVTDSLSIGRTILTRPVLTHIGRLSYGAYLIHIPLRGLASAAWRYGLHRDPATLTLAQAAFTALALTAATLGLAALSFRFFERPLLRLKPRLADALA